VNEGIIYNSFNTIINLNGYPCDLNILEFMPDAHNHSHTNAKSTSLIRHTDERRPSLVTNRWTTV
jgi:hypothetical protein